MLVYGAVSRNSYKRIIEKISSLFFSIEESVRGARKIVTTTYADLLSTNAIVRFISLSATIRSFEMPSDY